MPPKPKPHNNTLLNYFQKGTVSSPNLQKENAEPQSEEEETVRGVKRKINNSFLSDSDDSSEPSTSNKSSKRPSMLTSNGCVTPKSSKGGVTPKGAKRPSSNLKEHSLKSPRVATPKGAGATPKGALPKSDGNSEDLASTDWLHNQLKFLEPAHIMDANRNRPDHPNYDAHTLYVPQDFLSNQTPAMRQWWVLKSKHFDSILFFKVGKFYELYHMDAVIGVNTLALSYMRGAFAHSGFPEIAYGRMASSLVEQGYKVARVEQTETPELMKQRCTNLKKVTKFDKVVEREVCQVTTKATCIYGAQLQEAKQSLPSYMIAIAEKPSAVGKRFGVCFVDTSIAIFNLIEFDDDKYYSGLLALMAQHPPELILTERGHLHANTLELFKKSFINIRRDTLASGSQFYSAQKTLDLLSEGPYFKTQNNEFQWPPVLSDLITNSQPKPEYELALRSLGACLWYLKDSKIDVHVFALKRFKLHDSFTSTEDGGGASFMVLDALAINHLDLLGGIGSLQHSIDHCTTAFGKRLLQQWICRPLCSQRNIEQRQQAIRELMENPKLQDAASSILKMLPDLERLITKIHTFGNRFVAKDHPDSRAVFYEASIYSANKIKDLMSALDGFELTMQLTSIFSDCESLFLKGLTQHPPVGQFPDILPTLEALKNSFDQDEAKTKHKITPCVGFDSEYDSSLEVVTNLEEEIEEYRCEQSKNFGCSIVYNSSVNNRYLLEIPESHCNKVTKDYKLESSKKGSKPVRRYSTAMTRKFMADMIKAEAKRNSIQQDLNRRVYEKFSEHSETWQQVVQCVTMLDVISSLAEYATSSTTEMCFPEVLPFSNEPFTKIEGGKHPTVTIDNFVPNDTYLGTEGKAHIMILTGPNMGGKSTLMRQVALLTIMAQIGCPIPAESCSLTMVDRIFTRVGAQDDIIQGRSTFLTELSEAATVIHYATKHSLLIIDELGRGTSTHDGNAIASAYVNELLSTKCRTIFSTHYHTLVKRFSTSDGVYVAHMACLTKDVTEGTDDPNHSVTLLYKLQDGNCAKSFGFNVARLAGLPNDIIAKADTTGRKLEACVLQSSYFRSLFSKKTEDIASIIKNISELTV